MYKNIVCIYMVLISKMRFYSHWIHVIWLYKLVDVYYPFATEGWDTVTLFLYGIVGGCDYAIRMYPIWHNRLHAVNENMNVADKFSVYEFIVAALASLCSVYWFLKTIIPAYVWAIWLILAWVGHVVLSKIWKLRLNKLQASTYKHVPSV